MNVLLSIMYYSAFLPPVGQIVVAGLIISCNDRTIFAVDRNMCMCLLYRAQGLGAVELCDGGNRNTYITR